MMPIMRSSVVLVLVSSDIATAFNNLRMTPRHLQTYTQYSDYCQKMLGAVNAERAKAGLPPLCTNGKLAEAAKRHTEDMAANDYMGHEGSDGSTLSLRITDAKYAWNAVAENVAVGQEDVAAVMESWMNSDGHRANILGPDYTMLGTSYVYNDGTKYKHYWTQDFGAGETEACDGGSSNSSHTAYPTQKQDVAGKVSVPQETDPATTATPFKTTPPASQEVFTFPALQEPPASPALQEPSALPASQESFATIAPAATTPTFAAEHTAITEGDTSVLIQTARCKAKK